MKSLRLQLFSFLSICLVASLCPAAWATSLTLGQTSTGTISSPAQTDRYTFAGNSGDEAVFTVYANGYSPTIQLIGVDGTILGSAQGGNCNSIYTTTEMGPLQLPSSGTYTVLVSACNSTSTGSYTLFAQRTDNAVGVTAATFGLTEGGTIAAATQSNAYTFNANANDVLKFTMEASGYSPKLRLYNPDGTYITTAQGGNCNSIYTTTEISAIQVSQTGAYTVLTGACDDIRTGNDVLFVQQVSGNPGNANALLFDQTQGGTISTATQSDTYTFSGTAGDVLDFTMTSKGYSPKLAIYDPGGNWIGSAQGGNCNSIYTTASISTLKLTSTGTYTVLAGACNDTSGGDYSLSNQCFGTCLLPAPTLTSISPTSALAGGAGFTLTVNGTNFVNVESNSVVQWNGNPLTTTWVSTTQMTAAVPASAIANAGTFPVTVYTPAPGGGTSAEIDFQVNNPVPSVGSISPNVITAGGGPFTLTVNGSGFVSTSQVQWNTYALATTYVSRTQLTALVPASDIAITAAGLAYVTVFNPTPGGGTSSPPVSITINNPLPVTTSLSPTSAGIGTALTLTINGSNFLSTSTVNWNGGSRTPTFVSANQLTIQLSTTDTATPGTVPVTVTNPTPGGGTSTPAQMFSINYPAPTVAGPLSPSSTLAGGSGFTLTVNGTNFVQNGSKVKWNGSLRATTFVSSTQLQAAILASDIASGGTATVTVFNPTPGGGASAGLTFTITPSQPPVLNSISPTSATAGGSGFQLTVNGANFVNGSVVNWNGGAVTTSYVSGTQLTATIPAVDIATVGTFPVTVLNPSAPVGPSAAVNFTVNNPQPVAGSLSPSSAFVGGAAFTLTVNGSSFVNSPSSSVVYWNGSPLSTTYVSAVKLTAQVPAGDIAAVGTASVSVVSPGPGGGTSAAALTFSINNPVPAAASLSPLSALLNGAAFTLTVNGSNFIGTSQVKWNGSGRATKFVSATQLQAAILSTDLSTAGTASVMVVNPTPGGGNSSALSFTINNPVPVGGSLSPSSVWAGSAAFTLTVNGSGFVQGAKVNWNGNQRGTTYVSGTQLQAAIPATDVAKVGTASVTVVNPGPGGGPSSALTFNIVAPPPPPPNPVFTPVTGTYGAGQLVTISDTAGSAVTIYYTTNGTTPTSSSTVYTGPILVATSETIKALAVGASYSAGTAVAATYTLIGSPTVLAIPATSISASGATLTATANDENVAGQVWFVYGTSSTSLNKSTAQQALAANSGAQTVTASLTGLNTKTLYYVQPVVSTAGGWAYGAVLSFTTH